MSEQRFGDVTVVVDDSFVGTVEVHRPPNNYFEVDVIHALADAYEALDEDPDCRAILLCSEGKHFCAGANIVGEIAYAEAGNGANGPDMMNREAARMMAAKTPVVAAVQGAAVGAGFGLLCLSDFRICSPESRFAVNFAQIGYHHILGLTITLPAIVGQQNALNLLYTGRRFKGEEAVAIGLCDRLVPAEDLRSEAHALAAEIASSAPLAVRAIRQTMRAGLSDRFRAATDHEFAEQNLLEATSDLVEGRIAAMERRPGRFEAK